MLGHVYSTMWLIGSRLAVTARFPLMWLMSRGHPLCLLTKAFEKGMEMMGSLNFLAFPLWNWSWSLQERVHRTFQGGRYALYVILFFPARRVLFPKGERERWSNFQMAHQLTLWHMAVTNAHMHHVHSQQGLVFLGTFLCRSSQKE